MAAATLAPGPVVYVDGLPCAAGTAAAFARLKAGFERAFPGITLHVYSGWRSVLLQTQIFLERYVPASQVGARRVYDYRWWNGILYARISAAGTVAQPGTSNHGDGRALDIRDSGADAGVTRYGNARSAWIRDHAAEYGFDADGYRDFEEPWHIRFTGDQWAAFRAGPPELTSTSTDVDKEDPMPSTSERKRYGFRQQIEQARGWPVRLSGKDEHRFAATFGVNREEGVVIATLVFSGGTKGDAIANARIVVEEKHGDELEVVFRGEPVEIIATSGGSTGQLMDAYNLGPNAQATIHVQALQPGVALERTEYSKLAWRS
ncbi:D-alanyl-D-alanine carboxypeptidase family protein [Microbacterium rhizophilus]|uniref:D-alanyl-D-alanine carboxypeptidase family protein n=1 Tax=Microbacterium rhizophilus TaxID=3138934 RepID=UPI0031EE0FBF